MEETTAKRPRVVILASDDYIWSFPTWARTIPLLTECCEVKGLWLFPRKMGKEKGFPSFSWYFKVFGLVNALTLAAYGVKAWVGRLFFPERTWGQLSKRYHLEVEHEEDPNSMVVLERLREQNADIILSMVGYVFQKELIDIPRLGIINKHASILPSCRGLFPYFWACLNGLQTGVTFHLIDEKIDAGKLLLQYKHPSVREGGPNSMLGFYKNVFSMYPDMVVQAVERLLARQFIHPDSHVRDSYFGLPTQEDYLAFRAKGFKVSRLFDLIRP